MKMVNRFHWQSIDASYAQVYDNFRGGYSAAAIDHILKRAQVISEKTCVLDLACGTGAVFREFEGRVRLLVGMDASLPMLEQAKSRRPDGLACADGESIPLTANTIDLVTIGQAIHWFNLPALVGELLRVLRPGGWLALLSRYPSPAGKINALVEQLHYPLTPDGRNGKPIWSSMNSPLNLLGLEQAGFVDYERQVFQHEMELTVEGYLKGSLQRSQRQELAQAEQTAYITALEARLRIIAPDGVLRESFFDYVFMARKSRRMGM
jgi:ubiquinone/menaquinone biosynthesis C-methylase UbiE